MIEVDDGRMSRYHRRIQEEKQAAESSTTDEARRIHLQLMEKYQQMLATARGRDRG